MQQEVGFIGAVQGVDHLLIIAGAQSGHDQTLRFTTGEQSRAVCTWQQAGFAIDCANRIQGAPIDALAILDDIAAQNFGFQFFQSRTEVFIGQLLFAQAGFDRVFRCGNRRGAFLFIGDGVSGAHGLFTSSRYGSEEVAVIWSLEVKRLFRAIFRQIHDQINHRLDLLMCKSNRAEHLIFRQLIGFGFNHHHRIFGAGHNQIQALLRVLAQVVHVINCWIENIFTIDKAHTRACDWAHEWCSRNGQSRRGRDHRNHVRVIDQVMRQNGTDHQDFVFEARHEQRPDGAIDQA